MAGNGLPQLLYSGAGQQVISAGLIRMIAIILVPGMPRQISADLAAPIVPDLKLIGHVRG